MDVATCVENRKIVKGGEDALKNGLPNRGLSQMKQGIGNVLYHEKLYRLALRFYTEAIGLCPDSASFITKAKCHMQMHEYKEALENARKSIALDPRSLQGHLLVANCALALGESDLAGNAVTLLHEFHPTDDGEIAEIKKTDEVFALLREAERSFAKGEYFITVRHLDRILERLPARKLKLHRAECLALSEQYESAAEVASNILILDKSDEDALYVLGLCSYYKGAMDLTIKRLKTVLRASPLHKKANDLLVRASAIKENIEDAVRACGFGFYRKSHRIYSEALKIDSSNKISTMQLLLKRARISFKLCKLNDAIEDCSSALELNAKCIDALLLRGKLHIAMKNYEDAIKDYENICRISDCYEYRLLLKHAKKAMKVSTKKTYYSVLGVPPDASADEIRTAYRKKSLLHHPDRHVTASPEEQREQEMLFKEVARAYGALSDPQARAAYDRGREGR